MFGNFLYYIIALLIYSTYQPESEPHIPAFKVLFLFLGFIAFFFIFTWMQFKKIEARAEEESLTYIDQRFQTVLTRQSILAILIYAIDIYGLNISGLLNPFSVFKTIPTLEALIFLILFIGYLSIIWICAYGPYKEIYRNGLSKRSYVISNISFSIPIILPWLCLSATADIINILPFDAPRQFLLSTQGQIIYFMFFLFLIAIIGPVLIQKFWGCRPLRSGLTRHRIEFLCKKADMKFKDIMVWPLFGGRMITAGVMGLIKQFRYILVTPALMRQLNPYELDAVIAHEIGHIKKKHLLFYLFFFAGYLILAFTSLDLIIYLIIYAQAVLGHIDNNVSNNETFTSICFSLCMITVFLVYFRYIFGYFMRNFERQADLFSYTMMGSAKPLISTFEKIAITSRQAPDRPNWHHFSIKERIDYLKKCESDNSWIKRHNIKIRKSIAVYIAGILLVGWAGYNIHYNNTGSLINAVVLKKMIENRIDKDRQNPDLYQALGDIYYSEKNFEKTIYSYKKALQLNPDHVRALNNLAWLFATCKDKNFLNPGMALELAKHAASISKETHIMDTLAESYYVNGYIADAIEAEQQALSMTTTNREYYKQQLEKFKNAEKKHHDGMR